MPVTLEGPRAVGRYLDLGAIASGELGTLHFGRLKARGGYARRVAIMRLHPHLVSDPILARAFVHEAGVRSGIAHPNVVPTLDIVASQGTIAIVTEYVLGLSLARLRDIVHARGQRIPGRIASGIVNGAWQGLRATHHGTGDREARLDLARSTTTSHDILVSAYGCPRLLDFGMAKTYLRERAPQRDPYLDPMFALEASSPAASAHEIAGWLHGVAGDLLALRATHVADLERAATKLDPLGDWGSDCHR